MVRNIIQLPPKEGYKTAKQIMHKLYGDPKRLIAAYCKEIKQWPQIKPGDAESYGKFHNFLRKCENITQMQTFWKLRKLCACFYLNFQVEQEASGQGGSY